MANYLRGLSAGIIFLVVVAAAAAIYLHKLTEIHASEKQIVAFRAEHVERYLDIITQDLQGLKSRIEAHYAENAADRAVAAQPFGTVGGITREQIDAGSPGLRREFKVVMGAQQGFEALAYNDTTISRVYYESDSGFFYVLPSLTKGDDASAFRDFILSTEPKAPDENWSFSTRDIVAMEPDETSLAVVIPVRFAGTKRGVLGAFISQHTLRGLLTNRDSVGRSYLCDDDSLLSIDGRNIAGDGISRAIAAGTTFDSKALPGGLRVGHSFPPGEPYWAAARASMVQWLIMMLAAGVVSYTVYRALQSEIAERRRAERELRDAYGRQYKLSSRLRNLAHELTTIQHQERKRVATHLHDDLQQLLVAAQMNLKRKCHEDTASLISQAIEASRDLTQQLRPPALYEAGLVPALRTLAEQMHRRHSLEVIVDASDHERSEDLHDDVKALVFEAIRELIFNAVKHAETDRVIVRIRSSKSRLRVTVADQGEGFDIGHGEDEPADRFGFGLFSVRERLRALEGDMVIDSAPGQGTAIRLSVPIPPASEQESNHDETLPTPPTSVDHPSIRSARDGSGALRIVVVDDHTAIRQSLANALDSDPRLTVAGEAGDGETAVEVVERERPDILVMDVNMPRMNGIEATRHIIRRWPEITVFGLSVEEDTAVAEAMQEAGATSLLLKSMDLEAMIAEITGRRSADSGGSGSPV